MVGLNSDMPSEKLVNASELGELLGVSRVYVTALKKAIGIKGRYMLPSVVHGWLAKHPEWSPPKPDRGIARAA